MGDATMLQNDARDHEDRLNLRIGRQQDARAACFIDVANSHGLPEPCQKQLRPLVRPQDLPPAPLRNSSAIASAEYKMATARCHVKASRYLVNTNRL